MPESSDLSTRHADACRTVEMLIESICVCLYISTPSGLISFSLPVKVCHAYRQH